MKVRIEDREPASAAAILRTESVLGTRLSNSYRAFLQQHDGAKPESKRFDVGRSYGSSVRQFIPASEILQRRVHIDSIPEKGYPIAEDDCGNYILIDEARNGVVLFWDHETDDITEVATDFATFLECLQPFDVKTIVLKPEQVKRAFGLILNSDDVTRSFSRRTRRQTRVSMRKGDVALNQRINIVEAEKLSAIRTEQYFQERAGRADIAKAKRILKKAGKGNPPVAGDEL